MYKSFTSKAIFHGVAGEEEERWDRLQRWTYEKQEFILACVCARNAMLFGQKYPPPPSLHDTSPTRCLACKSNLNIHFQVRGGKKCPCVWRWLQSTDEHRISPCSFLPSSITAIRRNVLSRGNGEQLFFILSLQPTHQCPLHGPALLLPRSATSPQCYMQIRSGWQSAESSSELSMTN